MSAGTIMSKNEVLDLFAGAGGFSLGFEQMGCHIAGAVEIDAWASETFKYNHPGAIVSTRDISNFSDSEILQTFPTIKPRAS